MTSIVYRDGVMAADTRTSYGEWITAERYTKIRRLSGGELVGLSGDPNWWDRLTAFLCESGPFPDWKDDARALLAKPDGSLYELQTVGMRKINTPFAVIGSGIPPALGALHMGATARQAVEIAMLVDPYTGGEIDELRLAPDAPGFGGWTPCPQCLTPDYCESQLRCGEDFASVPSLVDRELGDKRASMLRPRGQPWFRP